MVRKVKIFSKTMMRNSGILEKVTAVARVSQDRS